jgi:hypothetical protein
MTAHVPGNVDARLSTRVVVQPTRVINVTRDHPTGPAGRKAGGLVRGESLRRSGCAVGLGTVAAEEGRG